MGGVGGGGLIIGFVCRLMGLQQGQRIKRGLGRGLIRGSLQYWDSFQQLIKMIVIHRMIIFLGNK